MHLCHCRILLEKNQVCIVISIFYSHLLIACVIKSPFLWNYLLLNRTCVSLKVLHPIFKVDGEPSISPICQLLDLLQKMFGRTLLWEMWIVLIFLSGLFFLMVSICTLSITVLPFTVQTSHISEIQGEWNLCYISNIYHDFLYWSLVLELLRHWRRGIIKIQPHFVSSSDRKWTCLRWFRTL